MSANVFHPCSCPTSHSPPAEGQTGFRSIVHVNEKGGRFGGTEEYIDLITPPLAEAGVCSHLVCGRLVGDRPAEICSTTVISGLGSRTSTAETPQKVVRAITAIDPDVVYLHNLFDPAIVTELARSGTRAMVVWYVHDHYLTCLSELRWRRDEGACTATLGSGCLTAIDEGLCVMRFPDVEMTQQSLSNREALSRTLGLVDRVIVVSGYMRDLLVAAQPALAGRIDLVARPIRDLGRAPIRSRLADEPAIVTFAGRITPEKGLDVVLRAIAAIETDAELDVRIAGVIEHAAYWEHCQRLAAAAMASNPRVTITALGHLDYASTDELFRRSDIVVIPSQWPEPLGSVALEAMSAGSAVVSSDIGGLSGTIDHGATGLLVTAGDPASWTRALDELIRDPRRASRIGQQAHRVARKHTMHAHVATLREIVGRGTNVTLRSA